MDKQQELVEIIGYSGHIFWLCNQDRAGRVTLCGAWLGPVGVFHKVVTKNAIYRHIVPSID